MKNMNGLLKTAVHKAGGRVAEPQANSEALLVVYFDYPEHMRFFKDYFSENFTARGEEVAENTLVFRCLNDDYADDVAALLTNILNNLEDEFEKSPITHSEWLSEHMRDCRMGVSHIDVLSDDIDTDEDYQRVLDNIRKRAAHRNRKRELFDDHSAPEALVDLWVRRLIESASNARWEDYVRAELTKLFNVACGLFGRQPKIINSRLDRMIHAVPYKAMSVGNKTTARTAKEEMDKADLLLLNMRALERFDITEYEQGIIRNTIFDLSDDLIDTIRGIPDLPLDSKDAFIAPLEMDPFRTNANPVANFVHYFLLHVLQALIVQRTKAAQKKVINYAKNLTPDTNLVGYYSLCLRDV